ncbi:MOSC domain-containing protein [Streptomyces sp. NPDC050504]|uniref:MOSC domain-containing protein n=1 Tax=Streptomyces sp. NPDC050504 TaxID=3365618 RepID=UPI0037BDCFE5
MGITVHALNYYPVKGCAGTAVESARVGGTGLEHDRTFMVVDAVDGTFRSQRKQPALAVVRPRIEDSGAVLTLEAPGTDDLRVEVDPEGERLPVTLFGKPVGEAVDQGDAVADWFSDVLGAKSRLVRAGADFDRDGWGEHPGKIVFADAHSVLVTSLASLAELNRRIAEAGADAVPMARFRPNVVLAGDGAAPDTDPHVEDRIRRMRVGGAEFGYSTRAMRCNVTLVDQSTGRRGGPEPLRTLATYRREPEFDNKVSFGAKNAVLRHGVIAVGDAVDVAAWA